MRTQRQRRCATIGLLVTLLLVPALAGAATSSHPAPPRLFDQLAAKAAAAEDARVGAAAASDSLQPNMIPPIAADAPGQIQPAAQPEGWLRLAPAGGPPGTMVSVEGGGFAPGERLQLALGGLPIVGAPLVAAPDGSLRATFVVPGHALGGAQLVSAISAQLTAAQGSGPSAQAVFTVNGVSAPDLPPLAPLGAPAASPALPAAPPAPAATVTPQPVKPWTLVLYMTAEGDQNKDPTDDLNELLSSASPSIVANVHIVFLLDRTEQPTIYGWVRGGVVEPLVDVTPAAVAGTNVDTGSPQAFVDFMQFVGQTFPAQRYAVSLWSHGFGWESLHHNPRSDSFWDMAELRDALGRGLQQLGKSRYDLLMFDACYMGGIEVLTEIRETADVVVAGSGKIPAAGLDYEVVLGQLGLPGQTPAQVAASVVQSVTTTYGTARDYAVAAYVMGASFDRLARTVDGMALELLRVAARQGGEIIHSARVSSTSYQERFLDIGEFAIQVRDNPNLASPAVQRAAAEVLAALAPGAGFVIAEVNSPTNRPSYGLTAYFPLDPGSGRAVVSREVVPAVALDERYGQLRIQGSGWFRMLRALATGQFPDLPPPVEEPVSEVPPAAAASARHDIIFAQVLNPLHVNLHRTPSTLGEAPLTLIDDGFINFYPRWSPDGRQLVYISDRGVPRVSGVSVGRNLFLVNSDGSSPGGAPRQLTNVGVNCLAGPNRGTPCTVEQVGHPAWLTDGSGLLYTLYTFDFSGAEVRWRSTVRTVSPDGTLNIELLPQLAGPNDVVQFLRYDTADLKAQGGLAQYLVFSYNVPPEHAFRFNPNFRTNSIGVFDFTNRDGSGRLDGTDVWGFFLHTASEFDAGNWLYAGFPAWRPGTNEVAFLYNRVGTPRILYAPSQIDNRPGLPPGVHDRRNPLFPLVGPPTFATFDIGRMEIVPGPTPGSGFSYIMRPPYWQFRDSQLGVGANFRPSWRPDGSNNLTLSVSLSAGAAWDVAVIASDSDTDVSEDTLVFLTQNGLSVTPSWGRVLPEDVRQRLVVTPRYLAPGASAAYILSGSGFGPDEVVTLLLNGQPIGQVTAGPRGQFEVRRALGQAQPGVLRFSAQGSATGVASGGARTSNTEALVVISAESRLFAPLIVR